ncbi:MAG: hypothetical protein IPN34_08770 [Planctomycetes bacterium]|nr:hypothetical protein [Planctomycetota bacterium]
MSPALRRRRELGSSAALYRPRLGAVLALYYLYVAGVWLASDRPEEGLWLSHLSLLLAGFGYATGFATLLGGTLVGIFLFHALWCVDAVVWLATGVFPVGITYYLESATAAQWLATIHHFFLFPLLAATLLRARAFRRAAWPMACLLFALAVSLARVLTPAAANVNGAFEPPPGIEGSFLDPLLRAVLDAISGWGENAWPAVMVVCCSFGNFLPVALLFGLLQSRWKAVEPREQAHSRDLR